MIEAGHALGGTDLMKILIAGQIFKGRLASLFENVDLLLTPVMYSQVPTLEQMAVLGDQPEVGTRLLRFTAPFNFSGHPTITLPCAFDSRGLPISFQLIGPHLSEELLCAVAHAYQSVTDWHRKHPPI
jgi:amidase